MQGPPAHLAPGEKIEASGNDSAQGLKNARRQSEELLQVRAE